MKFWCEAAFSLVEVTLALGIGVFCLLTVIGLMPVGVQTNRNAASQTAATSIIAAAVADLRATPRTSNTSLQFGISFGTDKTLYFDRVGRALPSLGDNARYQLNVRWSGTAAVRYASLKLIWPPTVVVTSPTPIPSGSAEMFAAFDRN
jgi:uncharacterized protein (TIGR02598 family)